MNETGKKLNVRISGKSANGEFFQELALVEPFGEFGMVIYTSQQLGLNNVIQLCRANGELLANAEVVWIRQGRVPAIEVVLQKDLAAEELELLDGKVEPLPPPMPIELLAPRMPPAGNNVFNNSPITNTKEEASNNGKADLLLRPEAMPLTPRDSESFSLDNAQPFEEDISITAPGKSSSKIIILVIIIVIVLAIAGYLAWKILGR